MSMTSYFRRKAEDWSRELPVDHGDAKSRRPKPDALTLLDLLMAVPLIGALVAFGLLLAGW